MSKLLGHSASDNEQELHRSLSNCKMAQSKCPHRLSHSDTGNRSSGLLKAAQVMACQNAASMFSVAPSGKV
jgi:hypothetical protein